MIEIMKMLKYKIILLEFLICFFSASSIYASDECLFCHKIETETFMLTTHSENGGCAICHGGTEGHLSDDNKKNNIMHLGNLGFKKANAVCLSCHQEKDRDVSERFRMVANLHDEVACYECHIVHLSTGIDHYPNGHRPDTFKGGVLKEENLDEDLGLFKTDLSVDCSICHEREADDFIDSEHGLSDLTCLDCHELHKLRTISQDIEEQIERCLFCHTSQELEFKYPYTHPLRERQIKCTDCHNPHSSRYDKMLKKDGDRACKDCHRDVVIKGGRHPETKGTDHPFRRVECKECHRPHGSNFSKLLKHSINNICNTCHN